MPGMLKADWEEMKLPASLRKSLECGAFWVDLGKA